VSSELGKAVKTGRNEPCTCGSGKKYKRCCGKDAAKTTTSKRKYRNSLDSVESGLRACWQNAQDLVFASQKLIENNFHALALSLAVIALEELAKFCAIDGLLYAKPDDDKATTFGESFHSHDLKLTIFEMLPFFIGNLSRTDPRCSSDDKFREAIGISLRHLKEDGNAVMAELGGTDFRSLDAWKQKGFYVNVTDRGFVPPRQVVEPLFAKAVFKLAWSATTALDLVLKGGTFERFIETARSVRAKLTEQGHQEVERLGKKQFQEIFQISDEDV
jgi:AbiV family abortive infection protein